MSLRECCRCCVHDLVPMKVTTELPPWATYFCLLTFKKVVVTKVTVFVIARNDRQNSSVDSYNLSRLFDVGVLDEKINGDNRVIQEEPINHWCKIHVVWFDNNDKCINDMPTQRMLRTYISGWYLSSLYIYVTKTITWVIYTYYYIQYILYMHVLLRQKQISGVAKNLYFSDASVKSRKD